MVAVACFHSNSLMLREFLACCARLGTRPVHCVAPMWHFFREFLPPKHPAKIFGATCDGQPTAKKVEKLAITVSEGDESARISPPLSLSPPPCLERQSRSPLSRHITRDKTRSADRRSAPARQRR